MNSVYLLVQLSCLTFISAPKNEPFSSPSLVNLSQPSCWQVYFPNRPERLKSDLLAVELNPKIFQDETAAFIILVDLEVESGSSSDTPRGPTKSIYYWFGKNVSEVLRTETVRHVANYMKTLYPSKPGQVPIRRCVSGLEPEEFQEITNRPYIPMKKLYKVTGQNDFHIVMVPVEFAQITETDPFVLDTSTYVIIFIPHESEEKKSMRAMQFGLYLRDTIYKEEKSLLYIDYRISNVENAAPYFKFFKTEIENVIKRDKQVNLNRSCAQVDEVKTVAHYYNPIRGIIEFQTVESTSWKQINQELIFHTCYVKSTENINRFIYIGQECNIMEINEILHFGELLDKDGWENLNIVQSLNLPLDFTILFPDCWEDFVVDEEYVKNTLNLERGLYHKGIYSSYRNYVKP